MLSRLLLAFLLVVEVSGAHLRPTLQHKFNTLRISFRSVPYNIGQIHRDQTHNLGSNNCSYQMQEAQLAKKKNHRLSECVN